MPVEVVNSACHDSYVTSCLIALLTSFSSETEETLQNFPLKALQFDLYDRDGVGTMISTDFYEGIRQASQVDLEAIEGLLRPLAQAGVTKARSRDGLMKDIHSFTVLERESEVTYVVQCKHEIRCISCVSCYSQIYAGFCIIMLVLIDGTGIYHVNSAII